jgi:HAMP domain-containing protein
MSRREFRKLIKDIMAAERAQRAIVGIALIAAFALIMYRVTRHIRRLTNEISDVAKNSLNIKLSHDDKGDELRILGSQFRHFTRELLESREQLKRHAEAERERLERDKAAALSELKTLSGLLPICASCKKIRDDKGYWSQLEAYITEHSGAVFSHGICPDCMEKMYPKYFKGRKKPEEGDK